MSLRSGNLYIEQRTRRLLKLLAQAESFRAEKPVTADEVGDRLLRETMSEKYPGLLEAQQKLDAMEKEIVAELKHYPCQFGARPPDQP